MNNRFITFICSTSSNLFKVDTTGANVLLAIASILTSVGFIFGNLEHSNYTAIQAFASKYVWATAFFIHGLDKILEEFYPIPLIFRVINSLFGMWLWNYIVLSFLLFDPSLSYPLEYTLITPIVIEVWYLTSLAYLADIRGARVCTPTQV